MFFHIYSEARFRNNSGVWHWIMGGEKNTNSHNDVASLLDFSLLTIWRRRDVIFIVMRSLHQMFGQTGTRRCTYFVCNEPSWYRYILPTLVAVRRSKPVRARYSGPKIPEKITGSTPTVTTFFPTHILLFSSTKWCEQTSEVEFSEGGTISLNFKRYVEPREGGAGAEPL